MRYRLTILFVAIVVEPTSGQPPPHPEVPSIRQLTPQDRALVAQVIHLAILDDLGKQVPNPSKVRAAFKDLPPESLPQLLEAFNHVANQGLTCPSNMIGSRISYFVHRRPDLDMAEFVQRHLGIGVTSPKPAGAFKDLQAGVKNRIKALRDELLGTLKAMKPKEMFAKVKELRGAEWREGIAEVGRRKDAPEAFDFLLGLLEKAPTLPQREVIYGAIVAWSGLDRERIDLSDPHAIEAAVSQWREWHKSRKQGG